MKIAGFQKLTLLDYPSKVACIIFTQGCNLRCPYCHNSGLIPLDSDDLIDEEVINSIPEESISETLEEVENKLAIKNVLMLN